ncbi:hypothetical protein PQJ75_20075 [Rhodoplanes sp. TEM]|uniref:Uncharacterized protein n=1 Tax=Rhodoplanes tepidamans TaxID=200616 RepID=A0ABT5JIF0_RHOTP|nr:MULTISPECIES: hypothetical protein [Rhodoplanes]MDC7789344.1 hypothetical protein [Rhodoplanes tepidamans]MDC7986033.1 hypothetical protein [Rhodoplanes sp. TEM]MDQ0358977.1 hypothetical protein [Rhodoplanes tepidamans]
MTRTLPLLAATLLAGLIVAEPAHAAYRVIRWSTGICQVWDYSLPTRPFPYDYRVLTGPLPSFGAATRAKTRLWRAGRCLI